MSVIIKKMNLNLEYTYHIGSRDKIKTLIIIR